MADDTTGRREQGAVDVVSASAGRAVLPAAPAEGDAASGTAWQEGGPGFGVIKLRGSQQGPAAGDVISIGSPGCNNHSASIAHLPQTGPAGGPAAPVIGVAWVESALGDVSGIGRIMLQRCGLPAGRADVPGLPAPANDNATWVSDAHGAGALGCRPAVASLDGGGTLVAWVGIGGNAHARLYGPSEAGGPDRGRADAPEYAAVNAALADLGPVVAAPDADRRVQVLEQRPGSFAVMWLALADSSLVLRGSLFVTPPAEPTEESPGNRWTEHKIADIRLPSGATGEFSLRTAGEESGADIVVSYAQLGSEAGRVDVLARAIEVAGAHLKVGQAGAEHPVDTALARHAGTSATSDHGAAAGHGDLSTVTQDQPGDVGASPAPSSIVTIDAVVNGAAPVVTAIGGGFVVTLLAPGALEGTVKVSLAVFDDTGDVRSAAGQGGLINVTDAAVAAVPPAVSSLGSGVAVSYVGASEGALVVEAFDGAGAQIGTEVVVDTGGGGAITEIAITAQTIENESAPFPEQLAVVYVQDNDASDGGEPAYGNIMLQQYGLPPATDTAPQQLVALGGDGQQDGTDEPVQLTTDSDGDGTATEGAVGRAPSATYLPDGTLAVIWVEDGGTAETIHGSVIEPDGGQVLRIDLTGLLGEASIAKGTKPTLLDTSDGDIVVSWLQPEDEGFVVMAALYEAAGPGVWIAPDQATRLQEFEREPEDFSVTVSDDEDSTVLTVTWRTDSSGRGSGDKVLSQRYDIDGNDLGWPVRVADNQMPDADAQLSAQTLSAAGLLDGQIVVVYTEQKSNGDVDLAAQVIDARSVAAASSDTGSADAGALAGTFSTIADQEIAIDVLADRPIDGLAVSRVNGVPITTAAPVDVGSGWVQLREDGRLTVCPNAGFTGSISFDYSVAGLVEGLESERHITVDVEADAPQAPLRLVDPVTAIAEDVSTVADIKVADIAAGEALSTDGLSIAGLDADMFKIVDTTLYLKAGIDLDFETKPTLSVEIRTTGASGPDDHVNFTLGIENAGSEAPDSHASADTFVFAPGLGLTGDQPGQVNESHEIIDLSSSAYATFQQLLDSGALVQDGADVVITIDPDHPAHSDKIILRGVDLSHLTSSDFKF